MKRIGLVGGVTWAATAEYYKTINLEVRRRLGGDHSAEMAIRSLDLQPLRQRVHDVAAVEQTMLAAAESVVAAGADFIAVASFTGHRYVAPMRRLPLPFVDLVDVVGAAVRASGYRRIAVWATSYAIADTHLMERLQESSGADLMTLAHDLRPQLDHIIFTELAAGSITPASTAVFQDLLTRQRAQGAQAILLATTDLSPLSSLLNAPVPILDATQIHCTALVDAALNT